MSKDLTEKQKEIIDKKGLFVVKSCPGSGKTFAVAARLAKLLSDWKHSYSGIACLSFTNIAWQEIDKYLREDLNIKQSIRYPHFLGTIDRFINQYVFLPFGSNVMGCDKRPCLIGPPIENWEPIGNGYFWENAECNKNMCVLNDFSYDINDNLINISARSHFDKCCNGHKRCSILKSNIIKSGFATQADANYFAVKVLKRFPIIAAALVKRFPVFIIDEAQDTSQIQMMLLDILIKSGLNEVMLIGDPYQAIFEWRNAHPELFNEKYTEWKDNSIVLEENMRSSQNICDCLIKLDTSIAKMIATNIQIKDCPIIPEIWVYTEKEYQSTIGKFIEICQDKGIILGSDTVAVLSRSNSIIEDICGIDNSKKYMSPWVVDDFDLCKGLAQSKYLFDKCEHKKAMDYICKAIYKFKNQEKHCSLEDLKRFIQGPAVIYWYQNLYRLISMLPPAIGLLVTWIANANSIFKDNRLDIKYDLEIKPDWGKNKYSQLTFDDIFNNTELISFRDYKVGNIHSVKGETFDAVLLFLKSKTTQSYKKILSSKLSENEELRILYVAMSRPRKILILAVPEKSVTLWKDKLNT